MGVPGSHEFEPSARRGRSDLKETRSANRYGEGMDNTLSFGELYSVGAACDAFFQRRGLRSERPNFGHHDFRRSA
jgi:hypothetical protein